VAKCVQLVGHTNNSCDMLRWNVGIIWPGLESSVSFKSNKIMLEKDVLWLKVLKNTKLSIASLQSLNSEV